MTEEEFDKIISESLDWAWNDFLYKPPEFWSGDMGKERMDNYIRRAAYAALEAAGVEVTH